MPLLSWVTFLTGAVTCPILVGSLKLESRVVRESSGCTTGLNVQLWPACLAITSKEHQCFLVYDRTAAMLRNGSAFFISANEHATTHVADQAVNKVGELGFGEEGWAWRVPFNAFRSGFPALQRLPGHEE